MKLVLQHYWQNLQENAFVKINFYNQEKTLSAVAEDCWPNETSLDPFSPVVRPPSCNVHVQLAQTLLHAGSIILFQGSVQLIIT